MRGAPVTYRFGDYQIEAATKRLTRKGELLAISEQQADVLLHLLANAGEIVAKNTLIDAGWPGIAVTDNSLEQAISALRRTLGDAKAKARLIETVPRRGYRFRGDVTRVDGRASDTDLAAMLEPYRALLEGRAALETLQREEVVRARAAFEVAVQKAPQYAQAHLGLAIACVLGFESTRADEQPDAGVLVQAATHAREACRLDPQSGDAWAALALVLHHSHQGVQAIAAARRAVMLEPDNWRHHLRLAYVAWGEERLRAAQRTLALFPGFALAHWLSATVYVARDALDVAERELRTGAAAQDAQRGTPAFSSVGLHWLLGLVRLARGDEREAVEQLRRELAFETDGQLYARECASNTWYALGAIDLRQGSREAAAAAFREALSRVPAHALARVGLSVAVDDHGEREACHAAIERRATQLAAAAMPVDAAMIRAAVATVAGGPGEAAAVLDAALQGAPGGGAGWLVPVEPLLNVPAHEPAFAQVLARLRTRAG